MNIVTPDWVKDAIFYQIFPDRFAKSHRFGRNGYPPKPSNLQVWGAKPTYHGFQGGDLLGIAEKLDYLLDLGINAIYLNPIFRSASNHRYHTHDYFVVDPILGGDAAFTELLEAAKQKGIRVVLDGVFNHASRGFFQFNHLMECGPESPYIDWFQVHGWPINAFSDSQHPNYEAWWGMHSLPKFNIRTPAVREFLFNVASFWLRRGIDGWRLDVPNEIDDDSFWQEFRGRCRSTNPEAYIVGELWGEAKRWLQGDQFDGQMNYMFTRSVLGYIVGDNLDQTETIRCGYNHIPTRKAAEFAAELDRMFNHLYPAEIVLTQMNMLGSHDTPRTFTLAAEDRTSCLLMYLCQMTVPGAPNVYYGDEIGMSGGHDPDCRRAFPWHDEASWDRELRSEIKRYIKLRRDSLALRRGDFRIVHIGENVVVYRRQFADQTAVIALNAGYEPEEFTVPADLPGYVPEMLTGDGENLVPGHVVRMSSRSGRAWVG